MVLLQYAVGTFLCYIGGHVSVLYSLECLLTGSEFCPGRADAGLI